MYKQASELKLRFQITVAILGSFASKFATGLVSTEQLWELPIPVLDRLAVESEKQYKSSGEKSFVVAKSKKDKLLKLQFDIVLDVLETKVEKRDELAAEGDKKTHNQKILGLIAEKEEEELKDLDVKDLKKLLK